MSFLDKIFWKKEEAFEEKKIEEIKMSLKEVEDFLANKLKKDFKPLKESAKKEYENLQIAGKTMQDKLKILEQASYPEKTYPLLIRKAIGSRKSFVEKMRILVKQIQKPMREDMNSIISFHEETAKLINITNAKTVKEYAFLKELFRKEGKEIVQSFRQVMEINKKLGDIVKEFKDSNEQLLKAQENIVELLRLKKELEKNETNELEEMIKKIENKDKEIANTLEKLPDSDDWKTLLEIQKIMEDLKISMKNKRYDFIQSVAKVEKPLKKYKWSVKNKILDEYVQNSFESILFEDPKGEVFMSALKDIKIKMLEGEIVLKGSDKFLVIIKNMIEENTMGKIIGGYLKLSEKLKKQKEKIASQEILKRKDNLENEMNGLKKEIEVIKAEKKIAEEQKKRMHEDKELKIKELENLLKNVAGKKVLLEVN